MSRAKFTGRRYMTRRGHTYGSPFRWWVRTDSTGWWEVRPPRDVAHRGIAIRRFPPDSYWTKVIPYVNSLKGMC